MGLELEWNESPVYDEAAYFADVGEGQPGGLAQSDADGVVIDDDGLRLHRVIDADGVIVARSERSLTISFGKMASVDLDRDTLPQPDPRVQIRAEVEVLTPGNPDKLSTSLEVFDNDSGKTTVFVWNPGD